MVGKEEVDSARPWSPELAVDIPFEKNPADRRDRQAANRSWWFQCWATPCDRLCVADISRANSPPIDEGDQDVVLAFPPLGVRCPDFSGVWLCIEVSGDSDRFLQEMGLDEELRLDAAKNQYGVQQQRQKINQTGPWFEIANELKAQVKSVFRIGGGVQSCRDHSGRLTFIDPKWDHGRVCLLVRSYSASMEFLAETRRFLQDGRMVVELSSPAGTTVRRIFELEAEGSPWR